MSNYAPSYYKGFRYFIGQDTNQLLFPLPLVAYLCDEKQQTIENYVFSHYRASLLPSTYRRNEVDGRLVKELQVEITHLTAMLFEFNRDWLTKVQIQGGLVEHFLKSEMLIPYDSVEAYLNILVLQRQF